LQLAVVAALAPHPVQMHRQFPCHGYLGNLPSPTIGVIDTADARQLRLSGRFCTVF
jgi:hypothetical protein